MRRYSIDLRTRLQNGDLGFFTAEERSIPSPVVRAAFALDEDYAVSPPVEHQSRWALVMRTGATPAFERPLAQVKAALRHELARRAAGRRIEDHLRFLQSQADIDIDTDALGQLRVHGESETSKAPPDD